MSNQHSLNPFNESEDSIRQLNKDAVAASSKTEASVPLTKEVNKDINVPPGTICRSPTWDSVAVKLLGEKFFLTALELHSELVEAGKGLPRLANFFSNPANFDLMSTVTSSNANIPANISAHSLANISRSCSQTTLDSLEWGFGGSEDHLGGGPAEERLHVLEFELRRARETIQALRTTLTQATANADFGHSKAAGADAHCTDSQSLGEEWRGVGCVKDGVPLQPHQLNTINFLVGEYLAKQGYKMAAITFAEEIGNQEFDNWDEVGLNMPRPPPLGKLVCEPRTVREHPIPPTELSLSSMNRVNQHTSGHSTDDEEANTFREVASEHCNAKQDDDLDIEMLRHKCLMLEKELEKLRLLSSTPLTSPKISGEFCQEAPASLDPLSRSTISHDSAVNGAIETNYPKSEIISANALPDNKYTSLEEQMNLFPASIADAIENPRILKDFESMESLNNICLFPNQLTDDEKSKVVSKESALKGSKNASQSVEIKDTNSLHFCEEIPVNVRSSSIQLVNESSCMDTSARRFVSSVTLIVIRHLRSANIPLKNVKLVTSVVSSCVSSACIACYDCNKTGGTCYSTCSEAKLSGIQEQLLKLHEQHDSMAGVASLVPVLLASLRNIVNKIASDRREELVPLLLVCAQHASSAQHRRELLNLLLLLSKKPHASLRAAVTTALLLLLLLRPFYASSNTNDVEASNNDEFETEKSETEQEHVANFKAFKNDATELQNVVRSTETVQSIAKLNVCYCEDGELLKLVKQLLNSKQLEQRLLGATCSTVVTLHSCWCRGKFQLVSSESDNDVDSGNNKGDDVNDGIERNSFEDSDLLKVLLDKLVIEKMVEVRQHLMTAVAFLTCFNTNDKRLDAVFEAFVHCVKDYRNASNSNGSQKAINNTDDNTLEKYCIRLRDAETKVNATVLLRRALSLQFLERKASNEYCTKLLQHLQESVAKLGVSSDRATEKQPAKSDGRDRLLVEITGLVKAIDAALPVIVAELFDTLPTDEMVSSTVSEETLPEHVAWCTAELQYFILDSNTEEKVFGVENETSIKQSVSSNSIKNNSLNSQTNISVKFIENKLVNGDGLNLSSEYTEDKLRLVRKALSQAWYRNWPLFDALTKTLLPSLVFTLDEFNVSDVEPVQAFVDLFSNWSYCFGNSAVNSHIVPLFYQLLSLGDSEELSKIKSGLTSLSRAPLLVFVCSILGIQYSVSSHALSQDLQGSSSPLQEFLATHLSILGLCKAPQRAAEDSVEALLRYLACEAPVLAVLWQSLVHKSTLVRTASASYWTVAARTVSASVLAARVLPGLVTMATDGDAGVRAAAIMPLVIAASSASADQQVVSKCQVQLESSLEETQVQQVPILQLCLAEVVTQCAVTAPQGLLYGLLLPRLCCAVAAQTNSSDAAHRQQLKVACVAAYSTVLRRCPPQHIVAHFILPPLQQLLSESTGATAADLTLLIKEFSHLLQMPAPTTTAASRAPDTKSGSIDRPLGLLSSSVPTAPVSSHTEVARQPEDVRSRVSKMISSGRQVANVSFPGFFRKRSLHTQEPQP